MKEILYSPTNWENRTVALENGVLFIPEYYHAYENFSFPEWQDTRVFGKSAPVYIEYCSGNGEWIAEKAKIHPEIHWVAVEKWFKRARQIWSNKTRLQLDNLFLVAGEGNCFSKYYVPENSVDRIYINFPDPWPKARHAKHRIMNAEFISELARILKQGCCIEFVTDDARYATEVVELLLNNKDLAPVFEEPYFILNDKEYGSSFFQNLWKSKGKDIYHIKMARR